MPTPPDPRADGSVSSLLPPGWKPGDRVPIPPNMVTFYRQYAWAVCVDSDALAAALRAIGARDQGKVEAILAAQPELAEPVVRARFEAAARRVRRTERH
jgi:hypothetical protein